MNSSSDNAISQSLPVAQIREAVGDVNVPGEAESFVQALGSPNPNALRCRRGIDASALPVSTEPIPWYELGRQPTAELPRPSRTLAFAAADFYLQDAGSLLALSAAGADTDQLKSLRICDLCAAPGGKASALLEALGDIDGGFLLANEPIRSRIGALQLNLARSGSDRFAISNLDPETLATKLPGVFDLVLVDAPCSGQALLGRGKQRTSSFSTAQIQHSAARQRRILDAAVRLLRDGGKLVYSTCTFAEAENEAQVQRLVDDGSVAMAPVAHLARYQTMTDGGSVLDGCYRLWPHLHKCAGSFAAAMTVTRPGTDCNELAQHNRRFRSNKSRSRKRSSRRTAIDWADEFDFGGNVTRTCELDSVILGWPDDAPEWAEMISVGGPELAHRAGKTWKPSHAAALRRVERGRCPQVVALDNDAAKTYLRGEPVACQRDGWQVVGWRERPLGWIKGSRQIGKNHLPVAARMVGELS